MNFLRFLFFFNMLYFWAEPVMAANNLSKDWMVGDRKMFIALHLRDRDGKDLEKVPLNKMFELDATVTAADGKPINDLQLIKFDAQMPAHRHGMVTKAKVTDLGSNKYLISGVKLHMPGMWKLMFDLKASQETIQVAIPLNL